MFQVHVILHPTDFSECAVEAERQAVRLVEQLNGELVLVHVVAEALLYGEGLLNIHETRLIYDAQRKWADGISAVPWQAASSSRRVSGGWAGPSHSP